MIIPTICVVGSKDSGKTTVAKNLIEELVSRGLRVAAAKHSHHSFNFSDEGRDTTLFQEAGARNVFFISPDQTVAVRHCREEEKLKVAIARYTSNADILVAEGWRRSEHPKVLVFLEKEKAGEREFPTNVKAVVCPSKIDIEAPHFQPEQIKELADYLLSEVLSAPARPTVTVAVNGKYLPTKGFVQEFIAGGILGMISSLKGIGEIESLEVFVRQNQRETGK